MDLFFILGQNLTVFKAQCLYFHFYFLFNFLYFYLFIIIILVKRHTGNYNKWNLSHLYLKFLS